MRLRCVQCQTDLAASPRCPNCGFLFETRGGILRALAPERREYFARFLEDYAHIRHAEGRGSDDPAYYRALPFEDLSGRNAGQWRIRAATYRYFERHILPERPADILDLGAGCGWFSYRVSQRGHRPVAVDIFDDARDGLAAARLLGDLPLVEAEFDRLPFADGEFDLAVFNSSLHYSADYRATLREALRCLRPQGRVVILDSPLYRRPEHGERMRAERRRLFESLYGFPSDSIPMLEYLDRGMLGSLARELGLRWRLRQPWYGLDWHLRPWKARLMRKRPPSRFCILVGSAA